MAIVTAALLAIAGLGGAWITYPLSRPAGLMWAIGLGIYGLLGLAAFASGLTGNDVLQGIYIQILPVAALIGTGVLVLAAVCAFLVALPEKTANITVAILFALYLGLMLAGGIGIVGLLQALGLLGLVTLGIGLLMGTTLVGKGRVTDKAPVGSLVAGAVLMLAALPMARSLAETPDARQAVLFSVTAIGLVVLTMAARMADGLAQDTSPDA